MSTVPPCVCRLFLRSGLDYIYTLDLSAHQFICFRGFARLLHAELVETGHAKRNEGRNIFYLYQPPTDNYVVFAFSIFTWPTRVHIRSVDYVFDRTCLNLSIQTSSMQTLNILQRTTFRLVWKQWVRERERDTILNSNPTAIAWVYMYIFRPLTWKS